MCQERNLSLAEIGALTTYQIKHLYLSSWDKEKEQDAVKVFEGLESQRKLFFQDKLSSGQSEAEANALWTESLNQQFSGKSTN